MLHSNFLHNIYLLSVFLCSPLCCSVILFIANVLTHGLPRLRNQKAVRALFAARYCRLSAFMRPKNKYTQAKKGSFTLHNTHIHKQSNKTPTTHTHTHTHAHTHTHLYACTPNHTPTCPHAHILATQGKIHTQKIHQQSNRG